MTIVKRALAVALLPFNPVGSAALGYVPAPPPHPAKPSVNATASVAQSVPRMSVR